MPQNEKHKQALALVDAQKLEEAHALLTQALVEGSYAELWNDWATVSVGLNRLDDACHGYEKALELDGGNVQCQFNLGILLTSSGETGRGIKLLRDCFPYLEQKDKAAVLPLMDEHQKGKRILVVHEVLPHFDRSGADARLLQLIHGLRAQGHQITYIGRNGGDRQRYEVPLLELGIKVYTLDKERLGALGIPCQTTWKLQDVLEEGKFDVAILDHYFWAGITITEHYLDEIRKWSPLTRIVVNSDDRHGVREWRKAELSGLATDRERALDFLVREVECYTAADMVVSVTEDDRIGMMEMQQETPVEFLTMTAQPHPNAAGYDDRKDFIFLADFNNPASRDAIDWFCEEIWPRILNRMPESKLHLAGNRIPAELAGKQGIVVEGFVDNMEETLAKFRVFVSPIRYGTGIKTKNLNAMSNGIPLITTTIGSEGMSLTDMDDCLIADTAGEFANKAVELYSNPDMWKKLAVNGPAHIGRQFSAAKLDAQLTRMLELVFQNPPKAYDPEHRFSMRTVEELHPDVLTAHPPESRRQTRLLAYIEMASQLINLDRPAEALEQLRHVFGFASNLTRSPLMARVLSLMERCYRDTGDAEAAERCGVEAGLCLPELNPALITKKSPKKLVKKAKTSRYALSVIIPTYNRSQTLARCLEALGKQNMSMNDVEVIVVDDGSTDDTQAFLNKQSGPLRLKHFYQKNQGVGAARKLAVDEARGEYLLLINDDTIATPDLLEEHLKYQHKYQENGLAVLGTFEYERAARRRALTHFLSVDPFMFPQMVMNPDCCYGSTHFVTCNLSVRRDLVLAAGNFDPSFRVGEDSDLGIRMSKAGTQILFNPNAHAFHDHLTMSADDIIRRAKAYGPVYLKLLRKHPSLRVAYMGTRLSGNFAITDIMQVRASLSTQREQVELMAQSLKQYDQIDFEPFFAKRAEDGTAADLIVKLFRQSIPQLHWFYLFDAFCDAWMQEQNAPVAPVAVEARV
jgi:GT2 family glycosyltransferase/glycosyltransferase involved in cell wall biosynthesis